MMANEDAGQPEPDGHARRGFHVPRTKEPAGSTPAGSVGGVRAVRGSDDAHGAGASLAAAAVAARAAQLARGYAAVAGAHLAPVAVNRPTRALVRGARLE